MFRYTIVDVKDKIDKFWEEVHNGLMEYIKDVSEDDKRNRLKARAKESEQSYEHVVVGIMYSILSVSADPERMFGHLLSLTTDEHRTLARNIGFVIKDKFPMLTLQAQERIFWLLGKLIELHISDTRDIYILALRQLVPYTLTVHGITLSQSLMKSMAANESWLCTRANVVQGTVFWLLRCIAEYSNNPIATKLQTAQIELVVYLLEQHFEVCAGMGRDLIRALQDVAKIPALSQLWKTLLFTPKSLSTLVNGIEGIVAGTTLERVMAMRVSLNMENELRFILTQLPTRARTLHFSWFEQKYLNASNSDALIADMIRYICRNYHPSNKVLASRAIKRYEVVLWLLLLCKSNVGAQNAKLALFYDCIFYNGTSNIMDTEVAILLLKHAASRFPTHLATLLEFLILIPDHYYPRMREHVRASISLMFTQAIKKGVISDMLVILPRTTVDATLRERFFNAFPQLQNFYSSNLSEKRAKETAQSLARELEEELANSSNEISIELSEPTTAAIKGIIKTSVSMNDDEQPQKIAKVESAATGSPMKTTPVTSPPNILPSLPAKKFKEYNPEHMIYTSDEEDDGDDDLEEVEEGCHKKQHNDAVFMNPRIPDLENESFEDDNSNNNNIIPSLTLDKSHPFLSIRELPRNLFEEHDIEEGAYDPISAGKIRYSEGSMGFFDGLVEQFQLASTEKYFDLFHRVVQKLEGVCKNNPKDIDQTIESLANSLIPPVHLCVSEHILAAPLIEEVITAWPKLTALEPPQTPYIPLIVGLISNHDNNETFNRTSKRLLALLSAEVPEISAVVLCVCISHADSKSVQKLDTETAFDLSTMPFLTPYFNSCKMFPSSNEEAIELLVSAIDRLANAHRYVSAVALLHILHKIPISISRRSPKLLSRLFSGNPGSLLQAALVQAVELGTILPLFAFTKDVNGGRDVEAVFANGEESQSKEWMPVDIHNQPKSKACIVTQTQVKKIWRLLEEDGELQDEAGRLRILSQIKTELAVLDDGFFLEMLRQLPERVNPDVRVFFIQRITATPLTTPFLKHVLVSSLDKLSMHTIISVYTTRYPSHLLDCLQILFGELNAQFNLQQSLAILRPLSDFCSSISTSSHIVKSIFSSLVSDLTMKKFLVAFFNAAPPQYRKLYYSLLKVAGVTKQ
eukprot:m.106698 g.106698  ORF g.106698 m.106698 type:complete len:1147 (-) comp9160_c2_seq2:355-3795(-)